MLLSVGRRTQLRAKLTHKHEHCDEIRYVAYCAQGVLDFFRFFRSLFRSSVFLSFFFGTNTYAKLTTNYTILALFSAAKFEKRPFSGETEGKRKSLFGTEPPDETKPKAEKKRRTQEEENEQKKKEREANKCPIFTVILKSFSLFRGRCCCFPRQKNFFLHMTERSVEHRAPNKRERKKKNEVN